MRAVRVIVKAAIPAAVSGGVEQIVVGLASGLAEVAEPGEEYIFLTTRGQDAWLQPHVDEALRSDLIRRGREVASRLSWTTTASRFRQLYLRVSGALRG